MLPYADYVLYDLKLWDSIEHHRYTGRPNDRILANAKIVADSGVEVLFRMPLIPGINDSLQNTKDVAAFLRGLGDRSCRIELMPYHRLGVGKYESLDRSYGLSEVASPAPDRTAEVQKAFNDSGVVCLVSE